MLTFRNEKEEIRLVWKILLLITGFQFIKLILKGIPTKVITLMLMRQGDSSEQAATAAREILQTGWAIPQIFIICESFIWVFCLWIMVQVIEKNSFKPYIQILIPRKQSARLMGIAAVGTLVWYYLQMIFQAVISASSEINWLNHELTLMGFILMVLSAVSVSLTQVLAFRTWMQRRLSKKLGNLAGILIISAILVIFQVMKMKLNLWDIFAWLLIYSLIGYLFLKTRSVYLLAGIHLMMQLLPGITGFLLPGVSMLILTSILIIFFFRNKFINFLLVLKRRYLLPED